MSEAPRIDLDTAPIHDMDINPPTPSQFTEGDPADNMQNGASKASNGIMECEVCGTGRPRNLAESLLTRCIITVLSAPAQHPVFST